MRKVLLLMTALSMQVFHASSKALSSPESNSVLLSNKVNLLKKLVLQNAYTAHLSECSKNTRILSMMEPTYVGVESNTDGDDVSSLSINVPSGFSVGDLMLATVSVDGNETFNTPAGWTLLDQGQSQSGASSMAVYYRTATATEPGNYTFSWSGNQEAIGSISLFSGVDTQSPVNVTGAATGNSSTPTSPDITSSVANGMIIRIFGSDGDGGNSASAPAGTTDIYTDRSSSISGDASSIGIAYSTQAVSGSTGIAAFSNNNEEWRALTIVLAPLGSGTGIPVGNLTCAEVTGEITGTVFEDFNYNGYYNSNESLGVENVTVTATDSLGNIFSDITDSLGNYNITGLTVSTNYRIEFTSLPTWASPTFYGGDNGTIVQFTRPGNCANLGVAAASEYCQINPLIGVPCYENGSGVGNTNPSFVTSAYNEIGRPMVYGGSAGDPQKIGNVEEIGSVWGTAYHRTQNLIYTTPYLKRHIGLGPAGLGGIYFLDHINLTISRFNLAGVTPDNGGASLDFGSINRTNTTGSVSSGAAGDYQLSDDNTEASVDLDAFEKIAKCAFGDLDLDEESNKLWTVNLNTAQQALISIDISDLSLIPTDGSDISGSLVNRYLLSDIPGVPLCNNGVFRPWAIAVRKGKGYLGGVCSAENGGTRNDLYAYVLSFDINNPLGGFTQEISFALDYERELASDFNHMEDSDWQPWRDDWNDVVTSGEYIEDKSPILSDIEFTDKGDMVLGFTDRMGDQSGFDQYPALSGAAGNAVFYNVEAAGDIIHVCNVNGSWVVENTNTSCQNIDPGTIVRSTLTNDGPSGNGEYYYEDYWSNQPNNTNTTGHNETARGALLLLKGKNEILTTALDPISGSAGANANTHGFVKFNTETGLKSGYYMIIDNNGTQLGKSGGLGDPQPLCNPAPIEIGNYVWEDTDGDGIQDPEESPLEGIRMELYDNLGNLLAFDTTNSLGQYYFSGNGIDNASWQTSNDTLLFNTDYYVVAGGGGQYSNNEMNLNGSIYTLTADSTDGGLNRYAIDSDGEIAIGIDPDFDGEPYMSITTGGAGEVNHNYDFGFTPIEFDLALKKVLLNTSPIHPGGKATFEVKIYNQGDIDATQVIVHDYIPSGFTLSDSNWDNTANTSVAVDTIALLASGDSMTLTITLQSDLNANGNYINNAEIVSATGGTDADSPLNNLNDGSSNELTTDNDIDDNNSSAPGSTDNPSDEDDYDPAQVSVNCLSPICLPPPTIEVIQN